METTRSQETRPTRARRRLTAVGAVVALTLAAAACGDSTSSSPKDTAPSGDAGRSVVIETFMFTPSSIKIHVGDTITWTNKDDILHTVTSGRREYAPGNGGQVVKTLQDGMFDKELDGKGATASYTFPTAGSFHYFCDRHPGMEADVEVS